MPYAKNCEAQRTRDIPLARSLATAATITCNKSKDISRAWLLRVLLKNKQYMQGRQRRATAVILLVSCKCSKHYMQMRRGRRPTLLSSASARHHPKDSYQCSMDKEASCSCRKPETSNKSHPLRLCCCSLQIHGLIQVKHEDVGKLFMQEASRNRNETYPSKLCCCSPPS